MIDSVSADLNSKFTPYQKMAKAIIDLTRKRGDCLPQDLLSVGFSNQETLDHWHMAQAMANVELKLMREKCVYGNAKRAVSR